MGYYVGLRLWSGTMAIEPVGGCGGATSTQSVSSVSLAPKTAYSLGIAVDGTTLAVFVNGVYTAGYTMSSDCSSGSVAIASSYAEVDVYHLDVYDATVSARRLR